MQLHMFGHLCTWHVALIVVLFFLYPAFPLDIVVQSQTKENITSTKNTWKTLYIPFMVNDSVSFVRDRLKRQL